MVSVVEENKRFPTSVVVHAGDRLESILGLLAVVGKEGLVFGGDGVDILGGLCRVGWWRGCGIIWWKRGRLFRRVFRPGVLFL